MQVNILLLFRIFLVIFLCITLCSPHPTQDVSLIAKHRLDPEAISLLMNKESDKKKESSEDQKSSRQRRKIVVRTKTPVSSDVVRPNINFVVNGKPNLAPRQEFIFGPAVTAIETTTATPAPLVVTNTTSAPSPFSWLTSYFPFNGLPTNIFSLSPMSLFGDTLFIYPLLDSVSGVLGN